MLKGRIGMAAFAVRPGRPILRDTGGGLQGRPAGAAVIAERPARPRRRRAGPEVCRPDVDELAAILGLPSRVASGVAEEFAAAAAADVVETEVSTQPGTRRCRPRRRARCTTGQARSSARRAAVDIQAAAPARTRSRRRQTARRPPGTEDLDGAREAPVARRHPRRHQLARAARPDPAHPARRRAALRRVEGQGGDADADLRADLAGNHRTLPRTKLLQLLRKHRGRAAFRVEEERRARLVAELQQARLSGFRSKAPVEAMSAKLADLPDGVSVERGRIEVRFEGAEDAVEQLYALTHALVNDYERFEEVDAGPQARARFLKFFAGRIARTRAAYGRAVGQFLGRCEARGQSTRHLAAPRWPRLRMLADWLVVSWVLPVNPAAAVRGPKQVVTKGATPVLSPAEARKLFAPIDTGARAGLRDRALLTVMLYSFARVSAVLGMRRQDYFGQGSRGWLRLHEKGGKRHDVAAHHGTPSGGRGPRLRRGGRARGAEGGALPDCRPGGAPADGPGARPAARPGDDQAARRGRGVAASTCCHTFPATGITAYLSNGGTLEHAEQMRDTRRRRRRSPTTGRRTR